MHFTARHYILDSSYKLCINLYTFNFCKEKAAAAVNSPCESAAPSRTPPPPICSPTAPARTSHSTKPVSEEDKRLVSPVTPVTMLHWSNILLSNRTTVFLFTHFFQFSDQLRRRHNILLTVILVDVAFVLKCRVWHFTQIPRNTLETRRLSPARFRTRNLFIPATPALLARIVRYFVPLLGLQGRRCVTVFVVLYQRYTCTVRLLILL